MFRTSRPAPPEAKAVETPQTPTPGCSCRCGAPVSHYDDPKVPKALREGRTFAERKRLAAQVPEGARLVSLGPTEHAQRNKHGGYDLVPVELFVDYDRRNRFFVKFPDYPDLIPLNEDYRQDATVALPPLPDGQRGFSKPDTGREATPQDPPPVPISGVDNPLYTPNP